MNKYTNMLNINKYINRIELNYEVIHQWLFFVIQNKRHRGDKNKCRVEPQKKKVVRLDYLLFAYFTFTSTVKRNMSSENQTVLIVSARV